MFHVYYMYVHGRRMCFNFFVVSRWNEYVAVQTRTCI